MSLKSLKKHSHADVWAKKQRLTSQLVRFCYKYLDRTSGVKAETMHALVKLSWITKNYDQAVTDSSYVISTKLPALGTIFNRNYSGWSLANVSKDIQAITGEPGSKVKPIIEGSTGFTNFYKAYRNSSLDWIRANRTKISTILKDTYSSGSDNQGVLIAEKIGSLSPIPSPSGKRATHPEYLLTPLCFCLDPRLRFPIINGADNVTNLLREFGVNNAELADKYSALAACLASTIKKS